MVSNLWSDCGSKKMKVAILCGGRGLRLNELTQDIPKSMVLVHGMPILWHICQHYKKYGYNDFIFCLGYKGDMIKTFFQSDEFNIQFVWTGENTSKSERLLQIKDLIDTDNFFLSYADDISDVNLNKLKQFHLSHKGLVTLTAVRLQSDFGVLNITEDNMIEKFSEKPILDHYINGGFYVLSKKIFKYLYTKGDFESSTLTNLAKNKKVFAYKHNGFWKSINTLKDVMELNNGNLAK